MRSVVVAAVAVGVLAASALGASSAGGTDSTPLLARCAPVLKLYASDRKTFIVGRTSLQKYLQMEPRGAYADEAHRLLQ